jgi:serine/threonine protein kinase
MIVRSVLEGRFTFSTPDWETLTPSAVDFVKKLLEPDHEKRLKAVTALNDKWLLNITKARGGKPPQPKLLKPEANMAFLAS